MSPTDAPPLSVLMPVRDCAEFLSEAIESILGQSFGDYEFLIFDDGSRDGSQEIALGYAKRDPRIVLYRGQSMGHAFWLREGVARARGEWIARMDGDDVSYPERFARQIDYLRAHPECVVLGASVLLVDPERRPFRTHRVPVEHEAIDGGILQGDGTLIHPVCTFRRSALLAAGNYRPHLQRTEDVDLFLRLGESGRLANLPEVLLEWRRHPRAVSTAHAREQRAEFNLVIADALRRRGLATASQRLLPDVPRKSLTDLWVDWARAALRAGHRATARHYARELLRVEPFAWRSWRLAVRAALGFSGRRPLDWLRARRRDEA